TNFASNLPLALNPNGGNVGVGVTAPSAKFHIGGTAGTDGIMFPDGTLQTTAATPMLTADRTYYVRTDGSDANSGLANTAGGAFLTIQKAIQVAAGINNNGFTITIQLANGTYNSGGSIRGPWIGN